MKTKDGKIGGWSYVTKASLVDELWRDHHAPCIWLIWIVM